MLNITKTKEAAKLTVALAGRLDIATSPELEKSLQESLSDAAELVMDLSGLEYISSAGLRVLLSTQKQMMKQGSMKVTHVNETVAEIFEVTGFADILTIE